MIIVSDWPLQIGSRHVGLQDGETCFQPQPFVVLRESDRSEWLAYAQAHSTPERVAAHLANPHQPSYFFLVSTD
jgi:hypothetical protein